VLDPDGVLLAGGVGDQSDPDVAWNGSAFVVAWTTPGANGTDVWIRRLTPELASIGPDGLPFAAASYSQGHVSLTTAGTSVVGIYDDDRDSDIGEGTNVYMNILDENGGMLDDGFAIATGAGDQRAGDVAASPAGVLATWTSYDTGASGVEPRPMARRFQGTFPSGQVQEIAPAGRAPTVAWGADGYLVAWSEVADDRADVVGRMVSLQVVLGDPFPITDDPASEDVVAVAASGSDYLVAATDKPSTGGAGEDILAVRVADAARLDDPPIRPATAARPQESPVVVEAGGTRVAVWAEQDTATGWDVRMGRIADDGSLLDGIGVPVATGADDERLPAVAWNGSRLLVAWFELGDGAPEGRIVARPFDPSGTALGPVVELGQGVLEQRPGIASNGGAFAVGWARHTVNTNSEPQVQLVDGSGATVGSPVVVGDLAISPTVSVAALGGGYVAAWSAGRIEARRIGAAGTLLDETPIGLSDSPAELYEDTPSVASSGNQVLVAWIQRPGSAIQAARLDATGTVLDPEPVGLTPEDPSVDQPTVGWNGVAYLVAWWQLDGLVTLAGAEVNRLGAVLETSTLAVVPHMTPGGGPPLVAAGTGSRNTIGYAALDLAAPGGGASRAYVRSIAFDTQAPTTTAPGYAVVTGALGAGTRPSVRISWTGADALSGVATYEVREQVDGGPWRTITTRLTQPSLVRDLAQRHTYRFSVRATDRAGNLGAFVAGATFRVLGVQEWSSSIRYAGSWARRTSEVSWGGAAEESTAAGSTATFTFTGRSVGWVSSTSPNRGRATVYVGGTYVATIDLYAASLHSPRLVWARTWSTSATRTITIRVSGLPTGRPRVPVDAFVVAR
jgi:hypothetical protein